MTASNHTATGMVLLAAVPHPIMLPVAFVLHFGLDALPHFGEPDLLSKRFRNVLIIDIVIAATLLLVVFILRPEHWLLIMSGGILCASPDLASIPQYITELRHLPVPKYDWFRRFAKWIQWGERTWGMVFEIPWFVTMLVLLVKLNVL